MQDTKILMDLDDIAEMYGYSRKYVRDILVKQIDFPAQAPGSTPRNPRWSRAKVEAFALEESRTIPE